MPIDHVNALPPGTRFEEYRLDAVLGTGGFGITYRAYDAHLDKFVAIKEYLPVEFATRTEASTVIPHSNADAQDYHWGLTRFLDEARTLARFDHSHLNRVHRFFESNGTAYMVLEYVQGETLADRLSREPFLEESDLQRLLEEILSGLEVMHEAGYVHRDIKPGNLMLREEDGSAVVLDFGAARQAVGQRSKAITSILTPGYAPIEQYDSKADDVGPWSDIYALGMVAYRCISGISDGELPDAVTRGRTQRKGQVDLVPAKEAGKGKYSPKLLEAIDWAMEVDEGDRPQTVDAWRQALAGGGRRKSPPKSLRKATTRPTRGTTTEHTGMHWSSVALTVVIVAVLGAGAWWGWQEYPELFGQGTVDDPAVVEQESQKGVETEPPKATETGQALASAEETPPPDGTSQPAPTEASVESAEPGAASKPVPPTEDDEVPRLLAAAEVDLKARRLTSPAGNNAWEKYQAVLNLDSGNPEAMAGVERVMGSYMELFGAAVEQEDFGKASDYLTRIRELHPDSPVLEGGMKRIEAAKQMRTDRLAEQERQRQAEEAARQAELERQRIEQAIEKHWKAFETALNEGNMDEAAGILSQIRDINPEAPGITEGEQRLVELERNQTEQIIQSHWETFEAALDEEDFEEAANSLIRIRTLDPDASGLMEGNQRLSARQVAVEKERELAGEMVLIPNGGQAFRIGKYEVTFAQWDACVADGGCGGYRPKDKGWGRGNRPVIYVSWDDAQLFIDWLNSKTEGGYRLPTSVEWSRADRGGATTDNSQICRFANLADSSSGRYWKNKECSDGEKYTAEVGRYLPNDYGLYDMNGNVMEWVENCWEGNCNKRMIRSNAWKSILDFQYSSFKYGAPRSKRYNIAGFRLARDP